MYICARKIDGNLCSVIYLGLCFMILFAADFTISKIQKSVLSSIHDENPNFNVDGYFVLGVAYTVFTVSLWLGPSIVSMIGTKYTFICASIVYTLYIAAFNMEEAWVIYSAAIINGFGAGMLWTAQGKYLIMNSEGNKTMRNVGVFSVLFALSTFYGNIYAYIALDGKMYIDRYTRKIIVHVLTAISTVSILMFIFVKPIKKEIEKSTLEQDDRPIIALKKTWKVFTTKEMLILCIMFLFVGMQQAFDTGIYGACLGFTLKFGNVSKQLVPLSGLFSGIGSLIGSTTQVLMSDKINKYTFGKSAVVMFGIIMQLITFILTFLNLPSSSVFGNTEEEAIIESSVCIALLCSILLGVGSSCYNIQVFSLIAIMFPNDSAQSCALFSFAKNILVSVTFYLSNQIELHKQLIILSTSSVIAAAVFCYIDRITAIKIKKQQKVQQLPVVKDFTTHHNNI